MMLTNSLNLTGENYMRNHKVRKFVPSTFISHDKIKFGDLIEKKPFNK